MKCDLVPPPWPLPVAMTPERRPAGHRGMDAAKNLLQECWKELILFVGRQHHVQTARPQDVKTLLDHVDFQLAFAPLGGGKENALKVPRQIPQVRMGRHTRGDVLTGELVAQTGGLVE